MFGTCRDRDAVTVTNGSGDSLALEDASVDCVVMDPPYYDNVMYAELADFFYVWLKRTAGLLYPEQFASYLTDKDREAVANTAKFKGQKGGAKNLAGKDYQHRMQAIFAECRRVLKPDGVMTVMFTHTRQEAWVALATAIRDAGFTVTKVVLTVRGVVPGITEEAFVQAAQAAKLGCPISRALHPSVVVELDARLV
jgi:adenine-specific DNA methylase